MALSNRDRVNAGFEILAEALDTFLTRVVKVDSQSIWIDLLEMVDAQKDRRNGHYSQTDPQNSLRFITEGITGKVRSGWYPLRDSLSRADEALASELRQTRNEWAHNKSFSPDDTYRALDTMERLIRATGNKPAADLIAERKAGIRVVQERRATERREQEVEISVSGQNLPPWRELVTPHEDVIRGSFNPSSFAADLHTVANPGHEVGTEQASASAEYTDPQQFFDRTYLTEGLKDLLSRTLRRVAGDATASPIVNLQTNFGGGKTHSMLAVWHIFGDLDTSRLSQEMTDLLQDEKVQSALNNTGGEIPRDVRRVALVGTSMSASGGMTMSDGTEINTMWGHLAWQLGGKDAYKLVRQDDQNGTNPGAKLRTLLRDYGPAVILIDEWVAYARQLVGENRLAGGTLSTQQSFAQALGEAVSASPGSMLLVSIPASEEMLPGTYVADQMDDEEVGGAEGREALLALMQVINRQAEQWRPAGAAESFEIVRRRIFQDIGDEAQVKIEAVAEAMRKFYAKTPDRYPYDATRPDYKTKITRCYPIHPELFDRLYEDWSVLPRFQRTRGVLRLMSVIVQSVWASNNSEPFIMPASIPINVKDVADELSQYLGPEWQSVIAIDVDGRVPHGIDKENPLFGSRHVATRLARAVFLGSAPRPRNSGLEERYVNLGTALPGDNIGNFHSALNTMANRSSHFYEAERRYWFDTSANITSVVREREEGYTPDDLHAEIEDRLHQAVKSWPEAKRSPVKVLTAPSSSADVPDLENTRLVIVPPSEPVDSTETAQKYVIHTTSTVGPQQTRAHKNTLVYLAADGRRLQELTDGVKKYLAWAAVRDSAIELDLTASQLSQATRNAEKWSSTVDDRLLDAYQWVLVPREPAQKNPHDRVFIEVEKERISSGQDIIARALEKLSAMAALDHSQAARILVLNITTYLPQVWQNPGAVEVGELWDLHTRYLYMPRLTHRGALEDGIRNAHHRERLDEGFPFALADDVEEQDGQSVFIGLRWPETDAALSGPALRNTLLLVNPEMAQMQFDREQQESAAQRNQGEAGGGTAGGPDGARATEGTGGAGAGPDDTDGGDRVNPAEPQSIIRYDGTFNLPIHSAPMLFARIDDEILSHYKQLAAQGADVNITLDITVIHQGGISESIQTMTKDSTKEITGGRAEFE